MADEVWLVRHGETEWSRDGRHTSTTDLPLTEPGRAVAATLRRRLADEEFSLVLTSPRERARETARLGGHPEAQVDDDLVEWDYGELEGLTTEQIRETYPGWTIWQGPVPGGESAGQVSDRLDRVVARCRATGGRVLLFGHGHCLRALAARWLELPVAEGRHLRLDTATISVLGFERDTPVVLRWNL
ncbi:MAG TPA: histidine phosphatase family protein [Nocardioides sp.]|uniref:histidine phosphatase family protein n=1 Tax=Nocardioides sp. TaxID=35761 RepID=UPI002E2FBB2D|nr:histidine phosphatase family protein [Nocardioides sp.]HEX3929110.1 histidine phosphatase family protein [Nocardioides sp.]